MRTPRDQALLEELDLGDFVARRSDTLERPHLQGRHPVEFHCEYVRDLTPADFEALKLDRGTTPRALVRIHTSHHSLAKCLAGGMRPSQAALITGYHPQRISQLTGDPSFAALVKDYQNEVKSTFADLAERMSNLSLDAIELLHERLQENPELFTVQTLLEVVKAMADRTGFGPNAEIALRVSNDFIDRPPRETLEEWSARRARELTPREESTRIREESTREESTSEAESKPTLLN